MIEPRDDTSDLALAAEAGVRYLLGRQGDDGGWEDYHGLPVGPATEWVTAFVAAALFDAGGPGARAAAARATARLLAVRPGGEGWGYSATTGPDADSTAWALIALRGAGRAAPAGAVAFLGSLHRRDGGFSTYPRDDGWGRSHPDVTPLVVLALPEPERSAVADEAARFALCAAHPDGTWPAYWWRGRHYSTYWNRVMLAALDRPAPRLATASDEPSRTVETAFDLAWVLALAVLDGDPPGATGALARLLVARQREDGGWPGGPDLRVTAPSCHRPWVSPLGARYEDDRRLITTASAVRALALVLGHAFHTPGLGPRPPRRHRRSIDPAVVLA